MKTVMDSDVSDFGTDLSENENFSEESVDEILERDDASTLKRKDLEEPNESRKKYKSDYVKPPTVQELNQLKETENLFNSSLFRLQIEEMLKEIQMKEKHTNLFQEWLVKFKTFVFSLKESGFIDLTDITSFKNRVVKIPISLSPISDKGKLKFKPPDDITVGGSFSIQASMGPLHSIDLHVHMPKGLFLKQDNYNLRFDRKRACYLSMLAEHLKDSELVDECNFILANGNTLKPLLELKPSGKVGHHIRVLLWPVTSPVGPLTNLCPESKNICSEWFLGTLKSNEKCSDLPSAHYNSGLAQDMLWHQNQQMLTAELSSPSLQSGLIMLKVWLHQRHLDKGYGSFGGFIMAMYLVYLLQNKRLNKMMSSYQVARVTWNSLAQSQWTTNGISLSTTPGCPPLSDFHRHFEVVFVDASGYCNLCANVKEEIYLQVKAASAQAVMLLDAAGSNNFHALFMVPVSFLQSYDHFVRFSNESALSNMVQRHCRPEQHVANAGRLLPLVLNLILLYVKKCFLQKVHSIGYLIPETVRWKCHEEPPSPSHISVPLFLGIRLKPGSLFHSVYKGPEADKPEAEEFRSFWGEWSHLRRYQDGQICEVLKLPKKWGKVLSYILKRHLQLENNSFLYLENLSHQITRPEPDTKIVNRRMLTTAFSRSQQIIKGFDSLRKAIGSLKDVTLSVNSVQGISPVFHFADVHPAYDRRFIHNQDSKRDVKSILLPESPKTEENDLYYFAPIEAVMMLELSGKWPQNLEAVRRLKAAICLQISEALQREHNLCTQSYVDHVDVLESGFVFRIWLVSLKEISLMKQHLDSFGLITYQDTPETLALEEKFTLLPRISSALHGLQRQHPGFGDTARLVKQWLSSQLLGPPHIPDLVSELLVAYLFLSPDPYWRAVDPLLGLMHFLRLMSCTDWLTVPLIINLNMDFTRERITELETEFHSSRKSLPPIFISTPYDRLLSQCTRTAPTLQILIRVGLLASEAYKCLESQLFGSDFPNIKTIFYPNMEEYDVIITLNENKLKRLHEKCFKPIYRFQLKENPKKIKMPIVGYDPAQNYLAELREAYGSCALFFHNQYGGLVIGVVWKPYITEEQDFKVSSMICSKPTKNSKVTLNIDAILEDFKIIGMDLVASVKRCDTGQEI